tara:strand:+ start:129 stop:386 length:258 start_codon:yes stop_codon:yes gene_type:complete
VSSRIGKQKAVTATARKIAVLFYNALRHGMTYQDQLGGGLRRTTSAMQAQYLSGLTPYEYICKIRTSEPERFIVDPIHQMPGLNT